MAVAGTLEYLISVDQSQLSSGLGAAESKVQSFGQKISSWAVAKGQVLGGLIQKAGQATVGFVKNSIQESMGFDAAMSQVAATLGKSTDEVQDLSAFAREMGSKTAFTATQAAEALNYMALAGYDSEKSMKMLPTVLDLAAAGGMDLALASDMVTDAQSALGLSIEETETLVDQMAKTSSKTNTSVSQLGEAILTVGGTAKSMKGGTTELTAVLGVLADNGIKGAEGGTALRNVLLSLTAPTDKAATMLNDLGIQVFDAEGNMREFPEILQDINEATKNMTQEQRTEFLSTVFNKRDLKSIEALLGTSTSRWEQLYSDIGNANNAAAEMAKTQLDNLAGDMTILDSAISEAKISLVTGLTPAMRSMVQRGTQWVTRLTKAFNERGLKGVIKETGKIVKESIAEMFDVSASAKWNAIGRAAIKKIKDGAKEQAGKAKVKLANLFGLTDENGNVIDDPSDTTWSAVAGAAAKKLQDGMVKAAGKTKVKISNLLGLTDDEGNAVDDPSDVSWTTVAQKAIEKLNEGFSDLGSKAKIKIADMLGFEDSENASWSGIANNILEKLKGGLRKVSSQSKIKVASLFGIEDGEGASWSAIASQILTKLKGSLKTISSNAKIKIAELLGIEDADSAAWSSIAQKILLKIKSGFKTASSASKIKIANLLGIEDADDASWRTIATTILTKIKTGFTGASETAKLKIADLLGIEDAEDATWSEIATKIKGNLTGKLNDLRLKAADLLNIENADDASWTDIAMKIANGLSSHFSKRGSFLKQLILGDEYTEKSTWTDVGTKLSGYLTEAFSEGGILSAILGEGAEQIAAIGTFAGNLMSALATWISSNPDSVVGIVTSFADGISAAAPAVINALTTILSDQRMWLSIVNGLGNIGEALLDTILGKDITNAIRRFFGVEIPGEISNQNMDTMKAAWVGIVDKVLSGAEEEGAIAGEWNDFMTKIFNESGIDLSKYLDFMDTFGFDNMMKNFQSMNLSDFYSWVATALSEYAGVQTEIGAIKTAAEDTAGDYDINFNVHQNGQIPDLGGQKPDGSLAKGNWNVPFDNYVARLHRDEMVLNASQARQYRSGENGSFDLSALADTVQSAIVSGMSGATVQSFLNGKDITRAVSRELGNQMKARRFAK